MSKNGRRIGKDAELEGAGRLNRLFGTRFRRSQQHKGATDAPDLIDEDHPELSPEVKRRSDFSIKLHRAVEQARAEAAEESTAFVLHRVPGQRWLLTVDLLEAPELVTKLAALIFDRLGDDWEDGGTFEAMLEDALAIQAIAETEGIDGNRQKRKGVTS